MFVLLLMEYGGIASINTNGKAPTKVDVERSMPHQARIHHSEPASNASRFLSKAPNQDISSSRP
jgi:hypothetical protein